MHELITSHTGHRSERRRSISQGSQQGAQQGSKQGSRQNQRGIALIVVLAGIAVLTILSTDMQYNTRIDATLAANARDELIATYNAKTAIELQLGILRALRDAQNTVKQLAPGLPLPNIVDLVPAECGLLGELLTLSNDEPLPIEGGCSSKATSEKGKIDINRLGSISEKFRVRNLLLMRLSDPRYDAYWETENGAGERVQRDELVTYLSDFTDLDTVKDGSTVGDEDDSYARMNDRYKVRNAPFDTVDELQLVYGIGDALFEDLRESLTVYPVGGVNLATADMPTIAAVIRLAAVNPNDFGLYSEEVMGRILVSIYELRQLPMGMGVLNLQSLSALIRASGLNVEDGKLREMIDDNASLDWYSIEATGTSGNIEKRLKVTYNLANNQLVYYREE